MNNFDDKLKAKLEQLNKLVSEKNKAYGDSITSSEKIFRLYYPDGIKPDQYGDVLLLVRVLDKLSRIATAKTAFNEEPWQDIVGYAIRGCLKDEPEDNKCYCSCGQCGPLSYHDCGRAACFSGRKIIKNNP